MRRQDELACVTNEQKEQIYLNENNLSRACHRNAILIGRCCAGGSPARQPGRACHHLPNRPRVCQPGRRGCSQSDRSRQWDDGIARAPSKAVPGESGLTHAALIAPQTLSLRHRNSLVSASDAPRATCFFRSAVSTLAARRCSLANFAERFVRTTSLSALCARSGLPPSEFDRKCDPRPSELAETLRECGRPLAFARILTKKPTVGGLPACCALRVARQPLRRASEQRDKLAPPSLARLACAIRAGLISIRYLPQN